MMRANRRKILTENTGYLTHAPGRSIAQRHRSLRMATTLQNQIPENTKMQMIQEKITFPGEAAQIKRERLISALSKSVAACSVTILNGRAGTGKTVLAADFGLRSERDVAWFKLDASDADWRLFFEYLIASVRRHRPGFGSSYLAGLVRSATIEDMPLCAETFVFELLEHDGDSLLIVLEDLHLIYDADWIVPFFSRLMPLLPSDVHMIITCRSLPPSPLWRMRSKQTLCVIDEGTLSFTPDEANMLFRSYGLSETESRIALEEARGRASALVAVARALCKTGQLSARKETGRGEQQLRQRHGINY
jgi:LuxR family maltose regulon positive regulatory protein